MISYIIAGTSNSEQVNDAGTLKKIVIVKIDYAVCSGKTNLIGSIVILVPPVISVNLI